MAVGNNNQIEKRLWDAADEMRANSKLKSSEYSIPVLGLIFLRYADQKFAAAQKELEGKGTGRRHEGSVGSGLLNCSIAGLTLLYFRRSPGGNHPGG